MRRNECACHYDKASVRRASAVTFTYAGPMKGHFIVALALLASLASLACTPPSASEVKAEAAPPASACAPWGGRGFALTVRSQSSHALQFRQFVYDDASGKLAVSDSDLFASGKEERTPRVIEKALTLSPAEREAVAAELLGICPDAKSMVAQEAPGGGTTVEIRPRSGAAATVRDVVKGGKIMDRFTPFFPELRTK